MRTRRRISYHGRVGHPIVHTAKTSGRKYIMVRKSGGGVKRLYEGSKYRMDGRKGRLNI